MPDTREMRKITELQSLAGMGAFRKRTIVEELERSKLIELIHYCTSCEECRDADIADHLIANGVVVQKWISVKERLPELERTVLVIDRVTGEITTAYLNEFNSFVFRDGRGHGANYWMPLPKPPKEGF